MPDSDKYDFDSLIENDIPDSGDDFFLFDDEPANDKKPENIDKYVDESIPDEYAPEPDFSGQKRSSADFSPDMDALLLTAQSPMIIEAMKLISLHDFKSKNVSIFSEAIKGVDLYKKILERNPENFKKLTSTLASDQDCMDVQKITFNLFRNVTGELPVSVSDKSKAFELLNDRIKNAYNKSLISSSIVSIKKFYLLSGTLDTLKIDSEFNNNPVQLKNQVSSYIRHINMGREMIKSGNAEIVKGMKGKELNVFIVKAAQMLVYYFGRTGETELQTFYDKLYKNFKNYFIVR